MAGDQNKIVESLAMPGAEDIQFEPARLYGDLCRSRSLLVLMANSVHEQATQFPSITAVPSANSVQSRPELVPYRHGSHLPFLDGLRGFAILLVMTFHSHGWISRHVFNGGDWAGIDVFFVLSGFLITRLLLGEYDRTQTLSITNFYTRRFLRLMPAFAVFSVCIYLVNPYGCSHVGAAIAIAVACLSDLDIALQWGHIVGSGLDITWSLSIEERFYAIWPQLILHFRKNLAGIAQMTIAFVICWKVISSAFCQYLPRQCLALDTRIDTLLIGCLFAIILQHEQSPVGVALHKTLRRMSSGWLLGAIFICVRLVGAPLVSLTDPAARLWTHSLMFIFDLLIGVLIFAMCSKAQCLSTRVLSWSGIRWLGQISYGLYLWHMFACFLIAGRVQGATAEFAGYALAIAMGSFSFYVIETPFLKLKNHVGHQTQPLEVFRRLSRISGDA